MVRFQRDIMQLANASKMYGHHFLSHWIYSQVILLHHWWGSRCSALWGCKGHWRYPWPNSYSPDHHIEAICSIEAVKRLVFFLRGAVEPAVVWPYTPLFHSTGPFYVPNIPQLWCESRIISTILLGLWEFRKSLWGLLGLQWSWVIGDVSADHMIFNRSLLVWMWKTSSSCRT